MKTLGEHQIVLDEKQPARHWKQISQSVNMFTALAIAKPHLSLL
jgi:hypothetical protein